MAQFNRRRYDYKKKFIFVSSGNPDGPTEILRSEHFETRVLKGTRWQLVLYPNGCSFQNFTSLYLQRASCDTGIENIFVDFSFECKESRKYVEFQNICFVRNYCWGSPVFSRIPSQKTENTFKITIRMSISKIIGEIDLQSHKSDLEALSKDFLDILMNGELSDLRLNCDGKDFLVHKCILAARCPKLASCIEEPELATDIKDNISSEVLEIILMYLYSAKLILPRVQIFELYVLAMSLEITDLIQQMHNHPYFYRLDTEFNVDHLNFDWVINSESLVSHPSRRAYPTNMYVNQLIMTCLIERVDVSRFCIIVSFNFGTFDTNRPIFLDFIIEENSSDRVIRLGSGSHIFFNNKLWERRIVKEYCLLPNEFKLNCRIDLCDGVKFTSSRTDGIIHVETSKSYCYYSRLPIDMLRFLNSEFLSDFLIISSDRREFKVHRAIMAARSSVFQKMLHHNVTETITGRMEIDDIDSATLQLMILYMYSGMIHMYLDCNESLNLYRAADKYDIQPLVLRCTSLILSNINSKNKQDVMSCIEPFNYNELKELIGNANVMPFSQQVQIATISDINANYLPF